MGVYDILHNFDNDYQIKIFQIPVYYGRNVNDNHSVNIGFIGGDLRHFVFGDDVPCKAMSYNFPQTFLAIDFRGYGKSVVHCFKDGLYRHCLVGEKEISDFDFSYWSKGNEIFCVDYYGNRLHSICNASDILDYIKIALDVNKQITDLCKPDEFFMYMKEHQFNVDQETFERLKNEHMEKEKQRDEQVFEIRKPLQEYCAMTEEDKQMMKLGMYGAYLESLLFHSHLIDAANDKRHPLSCYYNAEEEQQTCEDIVREMNEVCKDVSHQQYLDWLQPEDELLDKIEKAKNIRDRFEPAIEIERE